jgi:hypothetical protein
MNDVIGFDGRVEKFMPFQLQGILLSKLRRPLTIVLVLGFFAGSGPRTTTTTRTIRKFPRLNRPRRRPSWSISSPAADRGTEDDHEHEDDQEIPTY